MTAGPSLAAKPKFMDKLFGFRKAKPAPQGLQRPSAVARPQSVYKSNDQYIAELLKTAEQKPTNDFAAKNPMLGRGVNPAPTQPMQRTKDEKVAQVADWMAATKDGNLGGAPIAASANGQNRQVSAHQPLSAGSTNPTSNADSIYGSSATNTQANTGAQPSITVGSKPTTPSEYQGVQVPGMPDDAKLLWIKDRAVGQPQSEVKVKDMRLATQTIEGKSNLATTTPVVTSPVNTLPPTTNVAAPSPAAVSTANAIASIYGNGGNTPPAVAVQNVYTNGVTQPTTQLANNTVPINTMGTHHTLPGQSFAQGQPVIQGQPVMQGQPVINGQNMIQSQQFPQAQNFTQGQPLIQNQPIVPGMSPMPVQSIPGISMPLNGVATNQMQNATTIQSQQIVNTTQGNAPLANMGVPKTTVTSGGVIVREYPAINPRKLDCTTGSCPNGNCSSANAGQLTTNQSVPFGNTIGNAVTNSLPVSNTINPGLPTGDEITGGVGQDSRVISGQIVNGVLVNGRLANGKVINAKPELEQNGTAIDAFSSPIEERSADSHNFMPSDNQGKSADRGKSMPGISLIEHQTASEQVAIDSPYIIEEDEAPEFIEQSPPTRIIKRKPRRTVIGKPQITSVQDRVVKPAVSPGKEKASSAKAPLGIVETDEPVIEESEIELATADSIEEATEILPEPEYDVPHVASSAADEEAFVKRITAKIQAEVRAMEAKELQKARPGNRPATPRIASMEDRLVKAAKLPVEKTVIKKSTGTKRPTLATKKKPVLVKKKPVFIKKKAPTVASMDSPIIVDSRPRSVVINPQEQVKSSKKRPAAVASNKFEYGTASPTARANEVAMGHVEQGLYLLETSPEQAEEELMSALRVVAKSRDKATGTRIHVKSLHDAVTALWEADELHEAYTNHGKEYALEVASEFTTMVGKSVTRKMVDLDSSLQTYHNYARQALIIAIGQEPAGSEALYGMGRLFQVAARENPVAAEIENAKAKSFLLTSAAANTRNWKSTNELGVMFAREGKLVQATNAFKRSILAKPTPEAWQNLATIYEKQNKPELAAVAQTKSYSLNGGIDQAIPTEEQIAAYDQPTRRLFSLDRNPGIMPTAEESVAQIPSRQTVLSASSIATGGDKGAARVVSTEIPLHSRQILKAAPPQASSPAVAISKAVKTVKPEKSKKSFTETISGMFRAKNGVSRTANSKAHTRLR